MQGPTKFLDYVHSKCTAVGVNNQQYYARRSIVLAMDGGVVAPAPAPFSAELTPSPARPADFGEHAQLQCAHPWLRVRPRWPASPRRTMPRCEGKFERSHRAMHSGAGDLVDLQGGGLQDTTLDEPVAPDACGVCTLM